MTRNVPDLTRMSKSAIRIYSNGFTATGLIRADTQWTSQRLLHSKIPANERTARTYQVRRNDLTRLVALEEVAGSSPVGYPLICR